MLTIDLPPELATRLQAAGERYGRSGAELVRDAVAAHLDNLEDIEGAETALIEIREGRDVPLPLDEVERELGLAH